MTCSSEGAGAERLGCSTLSAFAWRAESALVQAALANTDEARRLAGEQLELARAFGRPRTLGVSLRASGLVAAGETRLELPAEAVKTLEASCPRRRAHPRRVKIWRMRPLCGERAGVVLRTPRLLWCL